MEEFDEAGSCSYLDGLAQAELTFEAATPRVQVAPVSHDHGVAIATCDHGDTLVSEGLEDLWLIRSQRTTVT